MAAQDWASSSSADSTTGYSDYDVFLNFRGEDTRNNFTAFLNFALKNRGINVFLDSEKLWSGQAIDRVLLRAIKVSKISIPIFSEDYACSKWCLRELAQIVQCHRSDSCQIVLPVFFHVEPSHVRNQTGSYEKAFREHEENVEPHIVESWREALRVVGNLKGQVIDKTKDQAEQVELVVERVLGELISETHLAESKHLIGIDSLVNDMESLLNNGSNDVQFVGICGFGGIGKTAIAKAVYNRSLLNFNKHCFLSDVREHAMQYKGLLSLQRQLLKDILQTDFGIDDYHKGKKVIEQRLCKEKVLVVLDDVDSQEQVHALAEKRNWFGLGSRVVITTRDEHILNVARVDKIYWPQVLDHKQSLQLFSWHAFQKKNPPIEYMELSNDVALYTGGLPLTIEVLGSYLSGISDKEEWECTLQKLRHIPDDKVHKRLRISYDNLKDDYHKAIFLDSACFFIGWEKETVISIWETCGYYPKAVINNLIRRSLLKFENQYAVDVLRMHDQIRDMGREIVREESPTEPCRRSRLWSYGDILEILKGHKGMGMIKGMSLPHDFVFVNLANEPFQMMLNMRFLKTGSNFMEDFSHFHSATKFCLNRLVYLDLRGDNIFDKAWNARPQEENKRFEKLKYLNFSQKSYLSHFPDFSWFPCLERLDLGYCRLLGMLNESIGQLSHLKYLILQYCVSLKKLADGVGLLEKLEVLDAKGCISLVMLPRSMKRMRNLRSIDLEATNISKFPVDFSMLSSLVELKVTSWFLQSLPSDMSTLKNLKQLKLCMCNKLTSIPRLPSSLVELWCDYCFSLVRLPDLLTLKFLTKLKLVLCEKLEEIQGIEGTESLEELYVRGCYGLTHTPRKILGQGTLLHDRLLWGDRYFSLTAVERIYNYNTRIILCVVLKMTDPSVMVMGTIRLRVLASIYQKEKTIRCSHELKIEGVEFTTDQDTIYIHYSKGFDWFGMQLQGKDVIEILDICGVETFFMVKFWKLLCENKEPDQQILPDQYSSATMVADFFNWSHDMASPFDI